MDQQLSCSEKLVAALTERTASIWLKAPPEVLRLYLGFGRSGAGPIPQLFTTMGFVREDTRWICQQVLPTLIYMNQNPEYKLDQLRFSADKLLKNEATFLAWLGFEELADFIEEFLICMNETKSREEMLSLLLALEAYAHRLQGWTTHYFPWGIGFLFPHGRRAEIAQHLRYELNTDGE